MLKKNVIFTDLDGNLQSEDFEFNLTKQEIFEMQLSEVYGGEGSLTETLEKIAAAQNGKEVAAAFENIILSAYGKRSEDGKRFIKSQALRDEFKQHLGYSELYIEIATKPGAAAEFINAVAPAKDINEIAENLQSFDAAQMSPSEVARQQSLAKMQGHQQKKPSEPKTVEIPATAEPVLEEKTGSANMTPEQFIAYQEYLKNQQ
jgi:hypothetical protein